MVCGNQSLLYILPNYTHKEEASSSTVSHDKAITLRFIKGALLVFSMENILQVCLHYYQSYMKINYMSKKLNSWTYFQRSNLQSKTCLKKKKAGELAEKARMRIKYFQGSKSYHHLTLRCNNVA